MRGIVAIMSMFVVVSPGEAKRFVSFTAANKEAEKADASEKDFKTHTHTHRDIQDLMEVHTDKEVEELMEKIKGKKAFIFNVELKRGMKCHGNVESSRRTNYKTICDKMLVQDGMLAEIKSEMETNKGTFTIMQFFQLQGLFEGDAKDEVSELLQPYVTKPPVEVEGMSDAKFEEMLKIVEAESWAKNRVPIYEDVCEYYAFTCAQVVKFLELETWGDKSLWVLQAFTEGHEGKGCIADPENKLKIIEHFREEFHKKSKADKAKELLNKLQGATNAFQFRTGV